MGAGGAGTGLKPLDNLFGFGHRGQGMNELLSKLVLQRPPKEPDANQISEGVLADQITARKRRMASQTLLTGVAGVASRPSVSSTLLSGN